VTDLQIVDRLPLQTNRFDNSAVNSAVQPPTWISATKTARTNLILDLRTTLVGAFQ
jgi:hypothetical protein